MLGVGCQVMCPPSPNPCLNTYEAWYQITDTSDPCGLLDQVLDECLAWNQPLAFITPRPWANFPRLHDILDGHGLLEDPASSGSWFQDRLQQDVAVHAACRQAGPLHLDINCRAQGGDLYHSEQGCVRWVPAGCETALVPWFCNNTPAIISLGNWLLGSADTCAQFAGLFLLYGPGIAAQIGFGPPGTLLLAVSGCISGAIVGEAGLPPNWQP